MRVTASSERCLVPVWPKDEVSWKISKPGSRSVLGPVQVVQSPPKYEVHLSI